MYAPHHHEDPLKNGAPVQNLEIRSIRDSSYIWLDIPHINFLCNSRHQVEIMVQALTVAQKKRIITEWKRRNTPNRDHKQNYTNGLGLDSNFNSFPIENPHRAFSHLKSA